MKPLTLTLVLLACCHAHGQSDEAVSTPESGTPRSLDNLVIITDPTSHPSLETSFTLVEPFGHYHVSRLGSPYIYPFTTRPAFTGRDLIVDYSYRDGDGFSEQQYDVELHWAFTQQIGLVTEIPYIFENIDGSPTESGFGDLTLAPRATVLETDRFLVALQSEFGLPTGSDALGNESTITPGIVAWTDLGNWYTLHSQIGIQHEFDRDETQLDFSFALIKSNSGRFSHTCVDGECDHSGDQSQFNLHLEVSGSTPINDADRGDFSINGIIGMSYNLNDRFDIRAGYLFPLSTPKEFDHGFTTGLIYQF